MGMIYMAASSITWMQIFLICREL